MKQYDIIVVGSGSGMIIVEEALHHGLRVALVDRGPLGGTCMNVGCIPSKMLIYAADKVMEIEAGAKLGVYADIKQIDFKSIMERMRRTREEGRRHVRQGVSQAENLDLYETAGQFVGDYTLEVSGEKLTGKQIFLASGSRPFIPPIKGLDAVDYLTNETLLELKERPESLVIIGGGYVGVEYAHFFAGMGTRVTVVEMADRLVLAEEPEMADLLKQSLARRMNILLGTKVEQVQKTGSGITVTVQDQKNVRSEIQTQHVLVAVGRISNADRLKVTDAGVELERRGYIRVNENLETTKKNIFAVGDANGIQMFTHAANREASLAASSALHNTRLKMDFSAVPHAVYSHPQIASVGLGEAEARKNAKVLVGRAHYSEVAKGEAMMEEEGFAKAIVDEKTQKILGFHIIGPEAPDLIQEVIDAMATGGHIHAISAGMHIHPALPELIEHTLGNLE